MTKKDIVMVEMVLDTTNQSQVLEYEFFQNFESVHTRKSYRNDIKGFLRFFKEIFHKSLITECEKVHIVAYRNWLSEQKYSPKSINRKISSLSTYFKFLGEKCFMESNPCEGIRKPKQVVLKETRDLTDNEVISLLETVNSLGTHLHRAILYVFFTTGIRKSELIEIKLKDFQNIDGNTVINIRAKGGKQLVKLLISKTVNIINDYLLHMESVGRVIAKEDYLFQPSKNPSSKIFDVNKSLRPSSIDYIFKKYCLLSGITKSVSPHSARATYIGSAIENGANIIKVSKDVGHSTIKTTEEYNKRKTRIEDSPAHLLGFLDKVA